MWKDESGMGVRMKEVDSGLEFGDGWKGWSAAKCGGGLRDREWEIRRKRPYGILKAGLEPKPETKTI